MSSNATIPVPLAVDGAIRIPVGPMMFPLRAIIMAGICSPLSFICINLTFMSGPMRMTCAVAVLMLAATLAVPTREGIWIGTFTVYRYAGRVMPSLIHLSKSYRALVERGSGAVRVSHTHGTFSSTRKMLLKLNHFADVPRVVSSAPGLIELNPGGIRAILMVEGPAFSLHSESYVIWCQQMMTWITSLETPVQFITMMTHFDSDKAQQAFDRRVSGWPRSPLLDTEREIAGLVAESTLGLRHYIVFAPDSAADDGIPHMSRFGRLSRASNTKHDRADRVLQAAVRMASSFNLDITVPDRDDIAFLVSQTVIGAQEAMVGEDVLRIGDQYSKILTMTHLPPAISAGVIVDAMMRTHSKGIASLHIAPVEQVVAQKLLHKRGQMLSYAARKGGDVVENQVAMQDTAQVVAAMAQREIKPVRLSFTMAVSHQEYAKTEAAAERMQAILSGVGIKMEVVTSPGFLPAVAVSPGGPPLGRSLLMTSDTVALRMLPCLGTPFSNINSPLLGINTLNGAPAYFSVWTPPNHNVVIVGSSGAGKSVTAKTMLARHLMEGVSAVIIDPDSEYRKLMQAVGGEYFELGDDAINPFSAGLGVPPDTGATLVLPILSVMGGDEKGVHEGRPIRRLPDEDQGWLHSELVNFYSYWSQYHSDREPVMLDVIDFIEHEAQSRTLTPKEAERCRVITARLRRYTQGHRARVFNRQSTFTVGQRPVAIGLKVFAMTYGADLTPALACVLTATLAAVERRLGRMIIAVDEAHRVTSDPDAGEVLGQLVRQARKYGAGVWMMSQRVEDFVHTDLGRTLASTASTKFILGTEEAVLEDVVEVFKLHPEERKAINPMKQGRGVLLSGPERTVIDVIPGPIIMALADTSESIRPLPVRHSAAAIDIPASARQPI